MVNLEKCTLEQLKNLLDPAQQNIFYFDYDRKIGVKTIKTLKELDDNFQKIIAFNEDNMITVYNLGEEIRYNKVEKTDFDINYKSIIKKFYMDNGKKLLVKVGRSSNGMEIFQYMGFEGSEK